MSKNWDAERFRKALSSTKDCAARDMADILGISPDYTENVPKLQFPIPSPHSSKPHPIGVEFDHAFDINSISSDTIFVKRVADYDPLQVEVRAVDEHTVVIQPLERPCSLEADALEGLDIIISPGVRMLNGRPFSGIHFRVACG